MQDSDPLVTTRAALPMMMNYSLLAIFGMTWVGSILVRGKHCHRVVVS
jgi:hypothetical protein